MIGVSVEAGSGAKVKGAPQVLRHPFSKKHGRQKRRSVVFLGLFRFEIGAAFLIHDLH